MTTRSLSDRLDSFAEAWKPKPGDKLLGVIVDLDERTSSYDDDPYPIVTVQTDDGQELAWHAFHTVARNELAKQKPVVGDRIGIAYHGKPEGKSYESYRVIVERTDGSPKTLDWSRHEATDEELDDTSADDETPKGATDDDVPF